MNLTAIISLESTRRKFFMNSSYIMSRKQESNVFGLSGVASPTIHSRYAKFQVIIIIHFFTN